MNKNFLMKENESNSEKNEQSFEQLYSQVGGHVSMKILNERYVCKPLNIRELSFYQNLPAELSLLVPTYHGTVSLDSDSQPRSSSGSSGVSEHIVLENLTIGYKKPCVLDLKMGTRMYGDFATEAKIQSQSKKSLKSTSAKLGVRFCGSQRFSVTKNNFEKLDKYVGRKATETEFKELLANFFFNNGFLRTDIICKVISEIHKMRLKLKLLDGFRFYSSSLLIIYEGKQFGKPLHDSVSLEDEDMPSYQNCQDSLDGDTMYFCKSIISSPIKVKIIDFANASTPAELTNNIYHKGQDGGFLMGLENLQEILEGLLEDEKQDH